MANIQVVMQFASVEEFEEFFARRGAAKEVKKPVKKPAKKPAKSKIVGSIASATEPEAKPAPEPEVKPEPPTSKFIKGIVDAWAAKMGKEATPKLIKKLEALGVKRVPEIGADNIRGFLDELEDETVNA